MNQFIYNLIEEKYEILSSRHKEILSFGSLEELIDELKDSRITPVPVEFDWKWKITRIDEELDFQAGNVRFVRIESNEDLANCQYPTV